MTATERPELRPIEIGLSAAILAVTHEQPRVLTVQRSEHAHLHPPPSLISASPDTASLPALPFAPLDPVGHRTLELGLRAHVSDQTGLELGYVEQLYTFGDRDRLGDPAPSAPRVISVAYLALVRESIALEHDAMWMDCYTFFPWEDWRSGPPAILHHTIHPALEAWIANAPNFAEQQQRRERAAITFGLDDAPWDGYRVLERYELLYEMGMVHEAQRATNSSPELPLPLGLPLALDHRRILSTALGRMRGKIKYRPVVFELLPDTFTLLQLQRVAEALSGVRLHKQNFRRLVERGGLVEGTGQQDTQTGGRPAELFRFRREVLRERPTPGVGLPGAPSQRRTPHGSTD